MCCTLHARHAALSWWRVWCLVRWWLRRWLGALPRRIASGRWHCVEGGIAPLLSPRCLTGNLGVPWCGASLVTRRTDPRVTPEAPPCRSTSPSERLPDVSASCLTLGDARSSAWAMILSLLHQSASPRCPLQIRLYGSAEREGSEAASEPYLHRARPRAL